MAKYRVVYSEDFVRSPISPWIHKPLDSDVWGNATRYEPPLPREIPGKGYPHYVLAYKGVELTFSSLQEIDHVIEVFSKPNMPTTTALSRRSPWMRGYKHLHWLTRLPAKLKNQKDRAEIVRLLELLKKQVL